jgi:hypothetical protein
MLFINQITDRNKAVRTAVESRFDNSRGDPLDFFLEAIGAEQDCIKLDHALWDLVAVLAASAHQPSHLAVASICELCISN